MCCKQVHRVTHPLSSGVADGGALRRRLEVWVGVGVWVGAGDLDLTLMVEVALLRLCLDDEDLRCGTPLALLVDTFRLDFSEPVDLAEPLESTDPVDLAERLDLVEWLDLREALDLADWLDLTDCREASLPQGELLFTHRSVQNNNNNNTIRMYRQQQQN